MFQTGYLTIKNVTNDTAFTFDFPNIEVKQAFLRLLMKKYARLPDDKTKFDQFNIYDDLVHRRYKIAIHSFQAIFDTIPYSEAPEQNARWFHRFFYIMFRNACIESHTLDTKDKIVVRFETDQSIIITGFSCIMTAKELMRCLRKNIYAASDDDKDIYFLSIYFDIKARKITEWENNNQVIELLEIPKNITGPVTITKIFLASSSDLNEERNEISLWISRKNKTLLKENRFLELVIWEELLHSLQGKRIQDYFNKEMLDCDIVIALLYTKAGEFTREEFDLAYDNLKAGKKPRFLFACFKEASTKDITEDYLEIIALRRKIQENGQLYISFDSTDSLILKLDSQLNNVMGECASYRFCQKGRKGNVK